MPPFKPNTPYISDAILLQKLYTIPAECPALQLYTDDVEAHEVFTQLPSTI